VQERWFQKQAKIMPKKTKTSTSLENVSKAGAWEVNYHFGSSDCQNEPFGITESQKQSLEQVFKNWRNWPLNFGIWQK
jgi:hypothetical protein